MSFQVETFALTNNALDKHHTLMSVARETFPGAAFLTREQSKALPTVHSAHTACFYDCDRAGTVIDMAE
jgi:hypothetical protein